MIESKEIKVSGKEMVVQGNKFLDTQKDLTLQEYKLFLFLISKIDPKQIDFSICRISASEFAKAIGIENSSYIYRDLQTVTKRLLTRVVQIHHPERELLIQAHLIDSAHYWYGNGYVDIKISSDMKPYLLALKREFTQYKLSQIIGLSSVYAIRLYEMLKKQEEFKQRKFFIDDLRKKLNIEQKKYKAFKDFRIYVLEIAKREINEKTDLKIDFEYIKSGKKVIAIQFNIKTKKQKTTQNSLLLTQDLELIKELLPLGFSFIEAQSLLYSVERSEAEEAINVVKDQMKKGFVKNIKALVKTAFEKKWSLSNSKKIKMKATVKNEIDITNNIKTDNKTEKQQNLLSNQGGFFLKLRSLFKR